MTTKILSIDCSARHGSVAVLSGSAVIASSDPKTENPSRADELLPSIRRMLHSAGLSLGEIDTVAVSTGPGSYSGIRIGLAMAAGLGRAIGIRVVGVSPLEALTIKTETGTVITAVSVGKHDIAWQAFEITPAGPKPISSMLQESERSFIEGLPKFVNATIASNSDLKLRLTDHVPDEHLIDVGPGLAESIGEFAYRFPDRNSLQPIYLRNCTHERVGF